MHHRASVPVVASKSEKPKTPSSPKPSHARSQTRISGQLKIRQQLLKKNNTLLKKDLDALKEKKLMEKKEPDVVQNPYELKLEADLLVHAIDIAILKALQNGKSETSMLLQKIRAVAEAERFQATVTKFKVIAKQESEREGMSLLVQEEVECSRLSDQEEADLIAACLAQQAQKEQSDTAITEQKFVEEWANVPASIAFLTESMPSILVTLVRRYCELKFLKDYTHPDVIRVLPLAAIQILDHPKNTCEDEQFRYNAALAILKNASVDPMLKFLVALSFDPFCLQHFDERMLNLLVQADHQDMIDDAIEFLEMTQPKVNPYFDEEVGAFFTSLFAKDEDVDFEEEKSESISKEEADKVVEQEFHALEEYCAEQDARVTRGSQLGYSSEKRPSLRDNSMFSTVACMKKTRELLDKLSNSLDTAKTLKR